MMASLEFGVLFVPQVNLKSAKENLTKDVEKQNCSMESIFKSKSTGFPEH